MVSCFRCMKQFEPSRSDQMFCSKRCRELFYADRKKSQTLRCSNCWNNECEYKNLYKGSLRPRNCPNKGKI